MNIADLNTLLTAARALTDDEYSAYLLLTEGSPISITDEQAALMKPGVDSIVVPAEVMFDGGTHTMESELEAVITAYGSLATTVEVQVTVLVDLLDWPTGQPITAQIVAAKDLDDLFSSWSHDLYDEPLFEDGLAVAWAPHEADPTEIQALQGDSQWVVWQGTISFNVDGTENAGAELGEFRTPTPDDLRLFGLLK